MTEVEFILPERVDVDVAVGRHRVKHVATPPHAVVATHDLVQATTRTSIDRLTQEDGSLVWIVRRRVHAPPPPANVLICTDQPVIVEDRLLASGVRWISPEPTTELPAEGLTALRDAATESWEGALSLRAATAEQEGLRPPQVGAVHALLAHWTVSAAPSTVIMPTGSGKTETMLALLAHERPRNCLVVVPSVALRHQIARKFESFGLLKPLGLLSAHAMTPVVGTVGGHLDVAEATSMLNSCNVIVTTMSSLSGSAPEVRQLLAESIDLLLLDEAHHVPARTWLELRDRAVEASCRVVQFTATPFRGDRKLVTGKVAYRYPLSKAQEDGLFTEVRYQAVFELDPNQADRAIAVGALTQLDDDLSQGLDHVLLARVDQIDRCEVIADLYKELTDHSVGVLHSQLPAADLRDGHAALLSGETRIVVCVDMLGEGFDLPKLKIAAIHDPHRSLGITLQFIGRFAREHPDLGHATVVANAADTKFEARLAELYADDAEWNRLLRRLHEGAVVRQERRLDFIDGFEPALDLASIQTLTPKMSTVCYRVPPGAWSPSAVIEKIGGAEVEDSAFNAEENTALYVTRSDSRVQWGEAADLIDRVWDLYLVRFDEDRHLLHIHSSDTSSLHHDLAVKLAGDGVTVVEGEAVWRVLAGINRLLVRNIGLRSVLNRSVSFTMHSGADVYSHLTEADLQNKMPSNPFGFGFRDGEPTTAGCSGRGRLWAYKVAEDISEWVDWTKEMSELLLDESIDVIDILRTTVRTEVVATRPPGLVPLTVEWPDVITHKPEDSTSVLVGDDHEFLVVFCDLEVVDRDDHGPLRFAVVTPNTRTTLEVQLGEHGASYDRIAGPPVSIRQGRGQIRSIESFLAEEPPIVRFGSGQFLVGSLLYTAPSVENQYPFADERIEPWDWAGTNIRVESLGPERRSDSIQHRVIAHAISTGAQIVVNDDDSGEAADVVALRTTDDEALLIELYHCKFSSEDIPGARVEDFYDVCGQAIKNVIWRGNPTRLFDHLIRREHRAQQAGWTRMEHGTLVELQSLSREQRYMPTRMTCTIVQPGLSLASLSAPIRHLLGGTDLYLHETYAVPLAVIASP